jgi:ribonuclease HII
MMVAGVLVSREGDLRALGLRDSKRLSPGRRESLVPMIREVATVETIAVPAADIDATRSEMTLNELEVRLFATILERLRPDTAYLDSADVDARRFGDAVAAQLAFSPRVISEHRADAKYPVVSAASIVAKVARDRAVREIEERIGTPIGSGYPSDPVTMAFLEGWIKEHGAPPPEARSSWETVKRLMADVGQTRMDEHGEE